MAKESGLLSMLRKIWKFIWENDSPLSWAINIVFAYILIRFLFYPGLGLLFGTGFPMVAVVSGSMEQMIVDHNGQPRLCDQTFAEADYSITYDEYWDICGPWYEGQGINKTEFSTYLFPRGFNKGDIIVIYGEDTKNLKIGDVIVFQSSIRPEPIIHRIVAIDNQGTEQIFTTKGDHNPGIGAVDENIRSENILGKGVLRVPYLGWVKIWVVDLIQLINPNIQIA